MTKKPIPYIIYYQDKKKGLYHAWRSDLPYEETIYEMLPPCSTEYKHYTMPKGYEKSFQGIKRYVFDFHKWIRELSYNNIMKIAYLIYYTDSTVIQETFKRLCKGKYEFMEAITVDEFMTMNQCYNGGLMYCKKGLFNCTGYDFKNAYAKVMGNKDSIFEIPTKEGEFTTITKLPNKLKYGIYRVKIECDHPDINKIFMFSKKHHYTHYCLNFIRKFRKRFDIKINIVQDNEPNALIYNDTIKSNTIFNEWYETLKKMRESCSKNNILCKDLLRGLWGRLCKKNIMFSTYEEINDPVNNIDIWGMDENGEYSGDWMLYDDIVYKKRSCVQLLNVKQPQQYNFRLKPYLTSFVRCKMAEIVLMNNLDSVVRIQTDSIVYDSDIKIDIPDFIKEEKNCGLIKWINVNKRIKMKDPNNKESNSIFGDEDMNEPKEIEIYSDLDDESDIDNDMDD